MRAPGTPPHAGRPVTLAGEPLESAAAAVLLLHGRGGSAADILTLGRALDRQGFAYLAPEAEGRAWYPESFLAPLAANEPELSSALALIDGLLERLAGTGIPTPAVLLAGFSQGGCLALEYAARRPRRYGGVAGLSAGLIGPPGIARRDAGSLDGTPVFLGCSEHDPHIPLDRVVETATVLEGLGAAVEMRVYPGSDHAVNAHEVERVGALLDRLPRRAPG